MKITWTHDDHEIPWPLTLEHKVDIFYHRILGWQLHVADLISNGGKPLSYEEEVTALTSIPHSGFAVLQICLSYFETIAQYQCLKSNDPVSSMFCKGVRIVFPSLDQESKEGVDEFLKILYKNARCGLYHSSMTRRGVGLGQTGNNLPMQFDSSTKQLVIDPHMLPKALKSHLELYRNELLNTKNDSLRKKFEHQFNHDYGLQ